MPYCDNCGEHVTRSYIRVFGQDGTLNGCTNCKQQNEMFAGEGAE